MSKHVNASGRTARLLRLITLLQNSNGWTIEQLISVLGISRRTLFRDLQCLKAADIPARYTQSSGYMINNCPAIQMGAFTTNEILGLMMLGKIALRHIEQPMIEHGLTALFKTVSSMPQSIREACTDVMASVDVCSVSVPCLPSTKSVFFTFLRMIDEDRSCTVELSSSSGYLNITHDILPRKVILNENGWTVCGNNLVDGSDIEIELSRICEIDQYGGG